MEWHRNNSNGSIASTHSQQYLLPSTSSMIANGQNDLPTVQQTATVHNGSFNANKEPLLHTLLTANSGEDFFKVQQAALRKFRSIKPHRSTSQMKSNVHVPSYKPAQDVVPVPDNGSAFTVQNTAVSNHRMSNYVNTVHQTSQQPPSVAVGQQFGNGYNATAVQQPLQNTQALQNYQATVTSYSYSQQSNLYNSVRPPANPAQIPCQQMAPNMPSSKRYHIQTDVLGPFKSQKLPAETNFPASNQNCRNVQNITGPTLANYRSLAPNMLSHAPQQQMNVPQTVPQLDGNANYYTQPRPNLQNALVNNSPHMSSSAPTTMPPTYTQTMSNSQNGFSASVNQNYSKQRQNYVAPNVQQPAQMGNPPPVQSSVEEEQSRAHDQIALNLRKREMVKLLLVYRDVRKTYELLNQENNLLRQRLQANTSQDNAGPPPLLSSLPNNQPQANCVMAGQQNVTQGLPVQNSGQVNSARGFHSQNVYDSPANSANQVGIQHILSLQENAVPNQLLKSDNGNHIRQNNLVFDVSQANVKNGSSPLQSLGSETTSRELRGQTNSNQYASSPNSSNGSVVHNRHGLHTSVAACAEKDGYRDLSSCTSGLTENGTITSVSWEAIEASLPLWKTVPQSSSQSTNKSLECQSPSQVDPSLAAFRILDEITSGPVHEISSNIPVQKPDSAIPNQANPQIAIVSPLVQSKEALCEDYQLSKIQIESSAVENTTINGFLNSQESDCLGKILQELESLGANTNSKNMDASRSKELPVASKDNVGLTLASITQTLSNIEGETSSENVDVVDDGLQISGICTLVEGNSFYDSSIAVIFDTSVTKTLPHTDTTGDHSKTVDTPCSSKSPCSTFSEAGNVTVKSEPIEEEPPMADEVPSVIEGDLHCSIIPSSNTPAEIHMASDQQESFCGVESSAISDQLTDLLTEFPYGIKNYMSENIHERTNGLSVKSTDKPVRMACTTEDFKPANQGLVINDIKSETVPSPSVSLQNAVELESETLMDLDHQSEKTSGDLQQTEGVSILSKDADGDAIQVTDTCSDDFEILSNSPASDIQITILDQDEIPKIFPDQNEPAGMEKFNETEHGSLQECANTVGPETKSGELKKESDVTDTGDKNLFCCLFSWMNLTNKNAPKCNCKRLDSIKVESTQLLPTNTAFVSKADVSPQRPELILKDSPKRNIGGTVGLETVQPDRPPKLEPVDSDHEQIKQPVDKPPKLERMVSEPDCVKKSGLDFSPKLDKDLKRSTSLEFQSVKNLMQNKPAVLEKSFTSCPVNEELTFRKRKSHSPNKFKSQASRKSEKLIIKTDFLKGKHPYKEKRKSEGKNSANIALCHKSDSPSGFLNSQSKPGKKSRGEKNEQNVSTVRAERSDQQTDRSYNVHKSPGVDRSRKSLGGRKRKEKESHFEKTRKVPSVQEYLERKRELCKKRSETTVEPSEGLGDIGQTDRRPETSSDLQPGLKRPLSPAKTNVTSKENRRSETKKARLDQSQSRGPHKAGYRKHKESKKGQKVHESKTQNLKHSSSKDKIYLTPCNNSRRASYEGINLAKLQIRHSPDKPKNIERRRSLESSGHTKNSSSDLKTTDSPKMLEFKLYPEFAHGSPTTQDKAVEATDPKAKRVVEGIKSNKEAWCNSVPLKKRKMENVEGQGFQKSPSTGSTSNYKPIEKNTTRPPQDSRTTFNVFKQMYHKQRSKSLDFSQGNS